MHYDEQREKEQLESWLMKGDCLERMKEIPDGSVDLIVCDLPYGTVKGIADSEGIKHGMSGKTEWDVIIDTDLIMKESDRVFLESMGVLSVPLWKRRVMFRAVRMFGWLCWKKRKGIKCDKACAGLYCPRHVPKDNIVEKGYTYCTAKLKSGPRKGEICNGKCNGEDSIKIKICKRHLRYNNPTQKNEIIQITL